MIHYNTMTLTGKRKTLKLLKPILSNTKATPDLIAEIFDMYRLLIDKNISTCTNCPAQIRSVFNSLKSYSERLKIEIKDEESKKNKRPNKKG